MNEHRKTWSSRLGSLADRAEVDFEVGLINSIQLKDAADGDLAEIEKVPELRSLRLESPKLSAAGYERLARLPNIDSLTIQANSALPKDSLTQLEKLAPWVVVRIYTTEEDRTATKEMNARRMAKFQDLTAEQKHMAGVRFLGSFGSGRPVYGKPRTRAELDQSGIDDNLMPFVAAVPELEDVYISDSDITSKGIAQLAGLKELKSLKLYQTKVSSIAALSGLTKIETLELFPDFDIKMGDQGLEGIQNFTNLQNLELYDESIADATVRRLASMKKLTNLDITVSKLEDENCVAALSGMTDLKTLAFYGGQLSDQALSHLVGLKKLETLGMIISRGDGAGFKHLAGLDALRSLSISGDGVTDDAIQHLSGTKQLDRIMAQTSKITPEGAKKLAASLPHVTIILEEAVVKSPRASFTFIRRKLNDKVSMLVPEDWETREREGFIHADEGNWSGSSVGPAQIQLSSDDRFKSAQEAMMDSVNTNAHLNPKISKNDIFPIDGSTDTASCIYRNKSGEHLVCAAKVGDRIISLRCEAPAARFAEFTPLFTYVGKSIRISDDAAKHAQETVEVRAETLSVK
jgi:Leucine-rich repeat (LRR) protein